MTQIVCHTSDHMIERTMLIRLAFGSYEGMDSDFACDECCGRGREDGNCIFINGENE